MLVYLTPNDLVNPEHIVGMVKVAYNQKDKSGTDIYLLGDHFMRVDLPLVDVVKIIEQAGLEIRNIDG